MDRIRFMRKLSLLFDYVSASTKPYTQLRLPYKKRKNGKKTKKAEDIRIKTALKSLLIMLITCGLIFPKKSYVK